MIAIWLRTELMASKRFSSRIDAILERQGIAREVVTEPDISDLEANALRRAVLSEYRGYGEGDNLMTGFPQVGVTWERVALNPEELLSVLYIDWDYWLELSGGSRQPRDAAKKILAGHTVYDVSNDGFMEIAAGVRSGQRFPPIILVTSGEPDVRLVVIEGHSRLTGYALTADALMPETEALLGTSRAINDWWAY